MLKVYNLTKEKYNHHKKMIKWEKRIGNIYFNISTFGFLSISFLNVILVVLKQQNGIKITPLMFIINTVIGLVLLFTPLSVIKKIFPSIRKILEYKFLNVKGVRYNYLQNKYNISYMNYRLENEDIVAIIYELNSDIKSYSFNLYNTDGFPYSDYPLARYNIITNEMEMHKICIKELIKFLEYKDKKIMKQEVKKLWN